MGSQLDAILFEPKQLVPFERGWQAQRQSPPSVEDIAAHWHEISDTDSGFAMPKTATEELGLVLSQGRGWE